MLQALGWWVTHRAGRELSRWGESVVGGGRVGDSCCSQEARSFVRAIWSMCLHVRASSHCIFSAARFHPPPPPPPCKTATGGAVERRHPYVEGQEASDGAGDEAGAERWESETLAFDNVHVHAVVARALGIDLRPSARLQDGKPPPSTDGRLSAALTALLFDETVSGSWPPAASSTSDGGAPNGSPTRTGHALLWGLLVFALAGIGAGVWFVSKASPEWWRKARASLPFGGREGPGGLSGKGAPYSQMDVQLPDVVVGVQPSR